MLEFDLVGTGETKQQAFDALSEAIEVQARASADFGNWDNLFRPAEGKYLRMYAEGRDVACGEVELHLRGDDLEEICIVGIDVRERVLAQDEELASA